MKFNIQKLQQGGGMPFVAYQAFDYNPQAQAQAQATSAKTSSKADDKEKGGVELLSKEIINDIIKTGMPNEVETFLKQLRQVESSGPFSSSFDTNKLYDLAAKGNQIITNAKLMSEATTKAYENGGLEELAVTTTGGLYVRNSEGGLSTVSMGDFAKNRDKYQALTVNDLSQARRYDSRLSFDKTVISTVQNAIGIDKISDRIVDILTKLGTESEGSNEYRSRSEYETAYKQLTEEIGVKQPTGAQKEGLKQLRDMYDRMGSEGVFSIKTENETQRNHIKEASAYILSTLSPNAINLLKARATVNGTNASPENLISVAFGTFTDNKQTSIIDYQGDMSKAATGEGTDASGKTIRVSALENLFEGNINRNDYTFTNPEDASFALTLKGSTTGQVIGLDNKPIDSNVLKKVLYTKDNTGIGALVDKDKMFFGNKKITGFDLDQIIYDGGQMAKAYVPVDSNGDPDFTMLTQYTEAEKHIQTSRITDPQEKNKIYREFGLNLQLDNNGKPTNTSQVKEFLVINGSTSKGTRVGKGNTLSYEPSREFQSDEKKRMDAIFKLKENGLSYPDAEWGPTWSNVVKAPIFLALTPTAHDDLSTLTGHGPTVRSQSIEDRMIAQKSKNPVVGSSQLIQQR